MGSVLLVIGLIVGIFIVLPIIFIWTSYNGLIRKKNYVKESWSQIDNQLKRKANILANMVDTVKMLGNYESSTLTKITELRTQLRSNDKETAMVANRRIGPMLHAMQESYPQLQGNQGYIRLMDEIKDCENKISYARTRYNNVVTVFNSALMTFPTVFFARMLNFTEEKLYELEQVEREYADNMRIGEL
ncbi:MAG: LemA family protein [Bacillaceae bacterium]|nr:LemA family protein [Bacillaceae bacterium]